MELFNALKRQLPHSDIERDAPMSRYTSMRVGGAAQCLLNASGEDEVRAAIRTAQSLGQPVLVIGNGTNLIVRDSGIRGLTIRIAERFSGVEIDGEHVRAQSGITLAALSRVCARHGLEGLEFASGIPGTLGGAVCMNAGAYGGEMSGVTQSVTALNPSLEAVVLDSAQCAFGYRSSTIRTGGYIALGVTLKLKQGSQEAAFVLIEELAAKRRARQPLSMPSAGSVFKRPEGDFAGRLIEEAGLKGACVGGAMVSPMHANFIVNTGDATASDVLALMAEVVTRVKDHAGITLESELCVVGGD